MAPEAPAGTAPGDTRKVRAGAALDVLSNRLRAQPPPVDTAALPLADLVDHLSPSSPRPVSWPSPAGCPPVTCRRFARPRCSTTSGLPVVAAVRERLAAVESHQLAAVPGVGGGPALAPWSNKAADPWQRGTADTRRMVVAVRRGGPPARRAGSRRPGGRGPRRPLHRGGAWRGPDHRRRLRLRRARRPRPTGDPARRSAGHRRRPGPRDRGRDRGRGQGTCSGPHGSPGRPAARSCGACCRRRCSRRPAPPPSRWTRRKPSEVTA